jgi:hypothetical protein
MQLAALQLPRNTHLVITVGYTSPENRLLGARDDVVKIDVRNLDGSIGTLEMTRQEFDEDDGELLQRLIG